ncbi:MAG: potassium transporter, partial [Gammaproteobacteria bacterium]
MPVDFFVGLFVLLGLAVLVVAVFRHFGLSPILGYLAVGLIAGPNGLGLLPDSEETRFLAELGVVFLMFTIGLEFTLPELLANRRQVLGMGGAEVLVVTLLGYGAGVWLGLDDQAAILVGGALAMSSTAVVIKQLAEQMELATRHGRASVAVLLFQDVATLPFLILLGSMGAAQAGSGMGLPVRLLVAVLVFAGLYLAGRWLARPFLHWIARAQSTELFMLAALFIVIGAALVVHEAGLSAPLGAFLAGMVLGETEFRHQVESDIRPFREVLLGLFFATVGMLLDPRLLLEHGWAIAGLALLIVLGKGVLISLLARLFGESPMASIQTGISLAQAGEFGLLLVAGMLSLHALPGDMGQILLGAMILSMALAPILIRHNRRLAEGLLHRESHAQFAPEIALQQESADLQGHVLIVGFGRIGQNLATLLQEDQFDYLALDLDATRVRHAREAGLSVVYGDASRRAVLEGVGVMRASALVITHDQTEAAMRTVSQARQMNPDLTILVRTKDDRHIDELLEAGATEVLPEGLEASLMLGAQLLILLGRPESEVAERMAEIRAERYHVLRSFIHSHGEGEADRSYRA